MTNYITKHFLTQASMSAILKSLLVQPLSTGKQTPSQPVLPGSPNIDNDAHGTKNLLLKIQVSEDLNSEVNLVIYNKLVHAFPHYLFFFKLKVLSELEISDL